MKNDVFTALQQPQTVNTHKWVLEPRNPSKSLIVLSYDLGACMNGLRTPKSYHLGSKLDFTAQEHSWTVNTPS